jgi:hypothetical protein
MEERVAEEKTEGARVVVINLLLLGAGAVVSEPGEETTLLAVPITILLDP